MCLVYFSEEKVLSSHQIFQMVYGHLRGKRAKENILGTVAFLRKRRQRWRPCRWLGGVRK